MKMDRPGSVCSDDLPSSPESVGNNSPSASPPHSPVSPDPYKDEHIFMDPYSPSEAPAYSYPPSPSYSDDPPFTGYGCPETFPHFETPISTPETVVCQKEFMGAVQEANYKEIKRILSKYSSNIQLNAFMGDGQTVLTQSCANGNLAIVEMLVSHGASIHLTNRDGFSPIHMACWCGKMDIMQYLLRIASRR